jgi:glucosamine kinase
MVAGFAGGRSPSNRAAFLAQDRLGCSEIRIVTDGYASLIGALGGEPGLVLAVGTGVTAYSLSRDGAVRESSGWGFPAGDEGGGAWIGHRAIQAYLKTLDGRLHENSVVFDRIESTIGRDFDGIQTWLAAARSTQFASLSPAVTASAGEGDALAERILDSAVAELEATIAAVDTEGSTDPIAVLGGLGAIFVPRLSAPLKARIAQARGSALDGLYLIATADPAREARA